MAQILHCIKMGRGGVEGRGHFDTKILQDRQDFILWGKFP